MLDPKQNSVDYGSLLMPPAGYILDRAVATTYSLDLSALLAIPVALYYSKPLETNFDDSQNPYDILNSISQASKTVTVFCQRGKIHLPKKHNKLLSMTQDCIVEVAPEKTMASFHPKCWWMVFFNPNKKKRIARFAVMSRNLTFDRSWDVAFSMEGEVTWELQAENQSMIDLLDYLAHVSGYSIPTNFKKSISTARFVLDQPFKSWRFFPINIGKGYRNPLESTAFRYEDILVMSPFVDKTKPAFLANKATNKALLFARKSELDCVNSEFLSGFHQIYCIPDSIVEGELHDSKEEATINTSPQLLDLHAKLYISKNGATNTWMLGSANCTDPAFTRNIECLLELKSNDASTSPSAISKLLITTEKENRLFDLYERTDITKSVEDNIDQLIRKIECDLMRCYLKGTAIEHDESQLFSYIVEYDLKSINLPKQFSLLLQPYHDQIESKWGHKLKQGEVNIIQFDHKLQETLLSKFFVVSITYKQEVKKQFLIKAEMELPETWSAKILAEILESTEKFLQYFQFLISENGLEELPYSTESSHLKKGSLTNSIYTVPIFEELMRTASRYPHKLRHINDIFQKLLKDEQTAKVIPAELLELWKHFSPFIPSNEQ